MGPSSFLLHNHPLRLALGLLFRGHLGYCCCLTSGDPPPQAHSDPNPGWLPAAALRILRTKEVPLHTYTKQRWRFIPESYSFLVLRDGAGRCRHYRRPRFPSSRFYIHSHVGSSNHLATDRVGSLGFFAIVVFNLIAKCAWQILESSFLSLKYIIHNNF